MHNAIKLGLALFMLGSSLGLNAAPRGANTADIVQNISVPGMVVDINPGGAGCNTGSHEVWTPAEGGCSDIEYQKTTAKVISLTPANATIESTSGATKLTAVVGMSNGKLAPAGVTVKWAADNGNLTSPQTYTNAAGEAVNTLSGANVGQSTVTATAAAGGATAAIVVKQSAPVIKSFSEQGRAIGYLSYYWTANTIYWNAEDAHYFENVFNWSAISATRYELVDPWGTIVYSGTSTTVSLSNSQIPGHFGSNIYLNTPRFGGGAYNYTLRAYNGTNVSTATVPIYYRGYECNGGCSS